MVALREICGAYQLAFKKDAITFVKLGVGVIGTKESCEAARVTVRNMDYSRKLTCVTRDNDGSNPWQMAILDSEKITLAKIPNIVVNNFDACKNLMSDMREGRDDSFVFCTSRDNDGAAPWIVAILKSDGSIARGSQSYNSYAECKNGI